MQSSLLSLIVKALTFWPQGAVPEANVAQEEPAESEVAPEEPEATDVAIEAHVAPEEPGDHQQLPGTPSDWHQNVWTNFPVAYAILRASYDKERCNVSVEGASERLDQLGTVTETCAKALKKLNKDLLVEANLAAKKG